jgi:pSer/pThr/pTyr-binding forkhead associated (FHA) protein
MNLSLVVVQGKSEAREIPIRLSQFIIGRDPECQLRPASPLVSKRHCAILVREGKAYIRDFDSTNGTLVNAEPIKGETEIKNGDALKVGPLNFKVKISDPAGAATSPETPAAAPEPPKEAAPKTAAKKGGFDEESLIDMLFNDTGAPPTTSADDPVPTGSTIMEGISLETSTQTGDDKDKKPDDKKAVKKNEKIDPASTANAAKAILDKYMRRPRT